MFNQLQRLLVTTGTLLAMAVLAVGAEVRASEEGVTPPATTVVEWVAQMEAALSQITDIRIENTEAGLQVILETADGTLATPTTTTSGNALILEIPNAVLALPDDDELLEFEPAEGIALVQVTQSADDQVEVVITGVDAVPVAEVGTSAAGLTLAVTPGVAQVGEAQVGEEDEALQIVVTGEEDEGYNPSDASTATRTDTPLRDVPQSIQVVPRQVIEDQQAQDIRDITRNVSGVVQGNTFNSTEDSLFIRGFEQKIFLQDGFRDQTQRVRETANIERVEVLRGPASVLYGTLEPGGIVNLITKQPLEEPLYTAELTVGNFGFVEPSIDFGGPLNESGTLLYRLNAFHESGDGFRDFDQGIERIFIAPSLTWKISDRTDITLNFEYLDDERPFDGGLVAFEDGVVDVPFDRIFGEPDDFSEIETFDINYLLEHRFNDNWKIRNNLSFVSLDRSSFTFRNNFLDEETGLLGRSLSDIVNTFENYALQTNVVGEFSTGSVEHTLLFGADLFRQNEGTDAFFTLFGGDGVPPINVFDPQYGAARPEEEDLFFISRFEQVDTLGIYLQDQIELSEQWHLLLGGSYDIVNQEFEQVGDFPRSSTRQEEAFSPRAGIVYQPIEPLSLYASFAQSFVPNEAVDAEGDLLEPERGTQYEVGIKGDFLDGDLSATLAAYQITKTNIGVDDPILDGVSRPIGEQRSRGVELDIKGEILPGWNIIATYAYTDAEITEDGGSELEGNRPFGVPENTASLWTTYEIQEGDLQGLGFGAGLFFVGERQGDTENSFQVPGYTRTDASIFYRRNDWRAAVNFQNLFDIDYFESAEGGRTAAATPGIPFTVLFSLSTEF